VKRQKSEVRSRKSEGKNPVTLFRLLSSGFWILTSLLFVPAASPARAQSEPEQNPWRLCRDLRLVADPPIQSDGASRIFADADSIESLDSNVSRLSGEVAILRGTEELFADQALYDRMRQSFELSGDVRYRSPQMELTGERLFSDAEAAVIRIEGSEFYFPAQHAAGRADRIERKDDVTVLENTRYSTCDPARPDWEFRAGRITLDHEAGQGRARNTSLRFKNVPVFYFPALSFPIDDRRKSGFLFPSIGDSDKHGFELEAPWYWNIAPQADATLTPHQMARRGVKLDSEWRYLNRWSMNELRLEYLDDEEFGDSRELAQLQHDGRFGDGWYSSVDYIEVSDDDYLDDFGGNLSGSSLTHLKREARLRKVWEYWEFRGRVLDFQTIDETVAPRSRPYRLNPSLEFRGGQPFGDHLEFSLTSSVTEFEHDLRIAGRRADLRPRLALPFGASGWHFIPALSARHTTYRLDAFDISPETEISRDVPTFSLDGGLVFERPLGADGGLLQTLEPRVFLLKTPFRNQDDIPLFDTRVPDLSFAQLFSENRFIGVDRVGDAEQASVALSSGLLRRDSGEEILRAGIGRIFYNEEHRVTLPGQLPRQLDASGLLAEIRTDLGDWSGSVTVEWNSERREADKELFRLRYQRDNRHIFNLAYRSRIGRTPVEDLEQSDLSFNWPLSDRWSAVGRWNRSLKDDTDLERFAGFQYESCCYVIRIAARTYLTETTGSDSAIPQDGPLVTQDSSVIFQLSLKGLGQIGDSMNELLERGIAGYRNPY
jgi:LPS-assembly protein